METNYLVQNTEGVKEDSITGYLIHRFGFGKDYHDVAVTSVVDKIFDTTEIVMCLVFIQPGCSDNIP